MSGNGDELDPREGGIEGGIDTLQQRREQRQQPQAPADLSPAQRQQLRQQAVSEFDAVDDPDAITLTQDGDSFAAGLTDAAQKRLAAENLSEQVDGQVSPEDIVLTDSGATLSETARQRLAAADFSEQLDAEIAPDEVSLTEDGEARLSDAAQKELAAQEFSDETEMSVAPEDVTLTDDGSAQLTDEAREDLSVQQQFDFDAEQSWTTEEERQQAVDEAISTLESQGFDAENIAPDVGPAGDVDVVVNPPGEDLQRIDDVVTGGEGPEGPQLVTTDRDMSQGELTDFVEQRLGVDEGQLQETDVGGDPGVIVSGDVTEGTDDPDLLRDPGSVAGFDTAAVADIDISDERRQELREEAAADSEQFDPEDFEVGQQFDDIVATPTEAATEEARQEQRQQLREEVAGQSPDFSPEDVIVGREDGQLQAEVDPGAQLEQMREEIVSQAIQDDGDILGAALNEVESDLSEEQLTAVTSELGRVYGNDRAFRPDKVPEAFRDAVIKEAFSGEFLGRDEDVIIEAGEALEDAGELTEEQRMQYGAEVSEASEDGLIDLRDLPDPLQERLLETYPEEAPGDISESLAFDELQSQTDAEIAEQDIVETEDGFGLSDQAQREVAAEQISTGLEDVSVSPDEVTLGEDGAQLSEEAQTRVGAEQLSDELNTELTAEDVQLDDDEITLTDSGRQQATAAQLSTQLGIEVGADNVDLTDEGGATLDPTFVNEITRVNRQPGNGLGQFTEILTFTERQTRRPGESVILGLDVDDVSEVYGDQVSIGGQVAEDELILLDEGFNRKDITVPEGVEPGLQPVTVDGETIGRVLVTEGEAQIDNDPADFGIRPNSDEELAEQEAMDREAEIQESLRESGVDGSVAADAVDTDAGEVVVDDSVLPGAESDGSAEAPANVELAGRVPGGLEGLRFGADGEAILEETPSEQGLETQVDAAEELEAAVLGENPQLSAEDVRIAQNYEGQLVSGYTEAFNQRLRESIAAGNPAAAASDVSIDIRREETSDGLETTVGYDLSADAEEATRQQIAERLEEQTGADATPGEDFSFFETEQGYGTNVSARYRTEAARQNLIESNPQAADGDALEEVAAAFDQQVEEDVAAEDVTFRRDGDGFQYALDDEFRRERATEAVAEQIQGENPNAESILARRGFSGLSEGDDYEVSVNGENVSAELTPQGRETVLRTLVRTENPQADSQLVREEFDGQLQFDDEGNISGTNRINQDSVSELVSGFEDATGINLPGDGNLVNTRSTGEQFGDIDWSFGLGGEGDEVEAALDDASEFIAGGARDLGETLFSEDVSGESLGEAVLDTVGREQLGDQYDDALRSFGAGTVGGTGALVASAPQLLTEVPEFAGYAALNPGKTAEKLPGAITERGVMLAESGLENPARFSGTLVGSTALSAGLFKATQGTRVGSAARWSLQPGEEAVKLGISRGMLGKRAAQVTPGVRMGQIESTNVDSSLGVSGRLDDVSTAAGSRLPDISVDADPNAGVLELSPDVRQSIREATIGRAANAADRISDVGEVDVETQRVAMGRDTTAGDAGVGDQLREIAGTVRERGSAIDQAAMDQLLDVAVRSPSRSGEVAEQQAFLRGSSRPSFDAPSAETVLGATRDAFGQGIQRAERAGRRVAVSTPDASGDVALQQAFTRGSELPTPSPRDAPGAIQSALERGVERSGELGARAADATPDVSGDVALQQAFTRGSDLPAADPPSVGDVLGAARVAAEQGSQRLGRAGRRLATSTPDATGDVALQQTFTRGGEFPFSGSSSVISGLSLSDAPTRARQELTGLRFAAAESATDVGRGLRNLRDLTIRVGDTESESIFETDGELDEPPIRSQIDDPLGLGEDGDSDVDLDADDGDSSGGAAGGGGGSGGSAVLEVPEGENVLDQIAKEMGSGESGTETESSTGGESEQPDGDAFDAEPVFFDDQQPTDLPDETPWSEIGAGELDTLFEEVDGGVDAGPTPAQAPVVAEPLVRDRPIESGSQLQVDTAPPGGYPDPDLGTGADSIPPREVKSSFEIDTEPPGGYPTAELGADSVQEPLTEPVSDVETGIEPGIETRTETETETEVATEAEAATESEAELEQEVESEAELEPFFEPATESEGNPFPNDSDEPDEPIVDDPFAEEQFEFDIADPGELVGGDDSEPIQNGDSAGDDLFADEDADGGWL